MGQLKRLMREAETEAAIAHQQEALLLAVREVRDAIRSGRTSSRVTDPVR
jgi:hypothetical protein